MWWRGQSHTKAGRDENANVSRLFQGNGNILRYFVDFWSVLLDFF